MLRLSLPTRCSMRSFSRHRSSSLCVLFPVACSRVCPSRLVVQKFAGVRANDVREKVATTLQPRSFSAFRRTIEKQRDTWRSMQHGGARETTKTGGLRYKPLSLCAQPTSLQASVTTINKNLKKENAQYG